MTLQEVPDIKLLWTDIETTGVDYDNDYILEMAWQVTNYLGDPLTEAQTHITVELEKTQLEEVLERYLEASPYVKEMHQKNGLWNEVFFGPNDSSNRRRGFYEVLDLMHDDIDSTRGESEVRLAGSSVGFDKRFIETANGGELPISHRVHDLSTFRPFLKWQGFNLDDLAEPQKVEHRALDDIARDIAQWRNFITVLTQEEDGS